MIEFPTSLDVFSKFNIECITAARPDMSKPYFAFGHFDRDYSNAQFELDINDFKNWLRDERPDLIEAFVAKYLYELLTQDRTPCPF